MQFFFKTHKATLTLDIILKKEDNSKENTLTITCFLKKGLLCFTEDFNCRTCFLISLSCKTLIHQILLFFSSRTNTFVRTVKEVSTLLHLYLL